jgi:ribosomal protein S2
MVSKENKVLPVSDKEQASEEVAKKAQKRENPRG